MTRVLSLAHLTALPLTPPQLVQLAADIGCAAAGIRLLPAFPAGAHYPLMDDASMLRETLARIDATGVRVLDIEVLRLGCGFDVRRLLPFLETGARLGAAHILVAGDDPDTSRLTASFAALCDAAHAFGLSADLEFMPWTAVPDLASAKRILAVADRPNAGVLVDAIHFARSASRLDQLDDLPRGRLNYAQICDARVPGPTRVDDLIHDARCARLLPGEGGIPLGSLFERLPGDIAISIEVPNDSRAAELGYREWARRARHAALAVLQGKAGLAA